MKRSTRPNCRWKVPIIPTLAILLLRAHPASAEEPAANGWTKMVLNDAAQARKTAAQARKSAAWFRVLAARDKSEDERTMDLGFAAQMDKCAKEDDANASKMEGLAAKAQGQIPDAGVKPKGKFSVSPKIAAAVANLNTKAYKNWEDARSHDRECAKFVADALRDSGVDVARLQPGQSAKDYGVNLENAGFSNIGSATTSYVPRTGDIAIFGAYEFINRDGIKITSEYGHMAMFNGNQWVSDFHQDYGPYPSSGTMLADIPYTVYRYSK